MTLRGLLHVLRVALLRALSHVATFAGPTVPTWPKTTCLRCHRVGREHAAGTACWWFSPPEQTNWSWCPGCGDDLVSQRCAATAPDGSCHHFCRCGTWSRWRYDVMPGALLLEHSDHGVSHSPGQGRLTAR